MPQSPTKAQQTPEQVYRTAFQHMSYSLARYHGELFGTDECAVALGITKRRVLNLIQKGKFARLHWVLQQGTIWRREDLSNWINAGIARGE